MRTTYPISFCFADRLRIAAPLMWAHAEYITLLRSAVDGKVFDRIPEVAARYLENPRKPSMLEIWGFAYPLQTMEPGKTLRILAEAPFCLHYSLNDWQTTQDITSIQTALGICYIDVPMTQEQTSALHFTFFWPDVARWENQDFVVTVQ